jgi:hypothetical protein
MQIKINNIECRLNHDTYEIVKWFPCDYYNKLQTYLQDGWIEEDRYVRRGGTSIQRTMFDLKELCFTIATLQINHKEPCIDLVSVGSRLLDLNETEREDFFTVYGLANDVIQKKL